MTGLLRRVDGLAYGGDYNPEQWDRNVWDEDVRLMQAAGVNLVSVGIFSWSVLEPAPGRYEFRWLDEVMDLLASAGIAVDLANGTASPPPWFSYRYPETLPMLQDGTRLSVGSRQAYCPSSPIFREAAVTLTGEVAERYKDHPALAMWHVSNEIGCHNARCYCDVSAAAFRSWLEAKYGDIDALNEAWGTAFWSQRYGSWAEIGTPRVAPAAINPTQQLDFSRFSSDACLDVYRAERDALRSITPDVPITTNFMVMQFQQQLDYTTWASEVDFLANDHYLDAADPEAHIELAFAADHCRSLNDHRPWLLMEHSTSAVNWQQRNVAKAPGATIRNSLSHIARGADGALFFQWRASRAGAEKFHSAMLPHAGADSARHREVVELGAILRRIGEVAGTEVRAKVALVFDWEAWWAVELDSHPSVDVTYLDRMHATYRALWRLGITTDVVAPSADLSPYRLVIVPTLYLVTEDNAHRLQQYVAGGGTAVVTYFSGIVNEHDHIYLGGYPGALRPWLGVEVEEFFPLRSGATVTLDDGATADVWTEHTEVTTADVISRFADGPAAGRPAVTLNRHGDGSVWYVATRLDEAANSQLMRRIAHESGVESVITAEAATAGLEAVRRAGDLGAYLFLINHGNEPVGVAAEGFDLVSRRTVSGLVEIAPGEVAVIREADN